MQRNGVHPCDGRRAETDDATGSVVSAQVQALGGGSSRCGGFDLDVCGLHFDLRRDSQSSFERAFGRLE